MIVVQGDSRRVLALLGVALLVAAPGSLARSASQEKSEAKQSIDLGGLSIEVPASWKRLRPSSQMRRAELELPPVEGDMNPGNLAVFVFPEGAGTVQANVDRWQQQFKGDDGQTPEVVSAKVQGQNVEVTRVEVAGTYVEPPFAGGGTFPNYRLLGAIVETTDGSYFLKLVGPDKTIQAAEEGFNAMIASMKTK